jgi:hypothetical protein
MAKDVKVVITIPQNSGAHQISIALAVYLLFYIHPSIVVYGITEYVHECYLDDHLYVIGSITVFTSKWCSGLGLKWD